MTISICPLFADIFENIYWYEKRSTPTEIVEKINKYIISDVSCASLINFICLIYSIAGKTVILELVPERIPINGTADNTVKASESEAKAPTTKNSIIDLFNTIEI